MVARGVGRELAASVAAHRDILYRIQHPCGMIIPCFSPVVNTFFCGFGGSRNFRDIVTKTTGYSGVVWLKGRPGRHGGKGRTTRPAGGACPAGRRLTLPPLSPAGGVPSLLPVYPAFGLLYRPHPPARARRALFPSGEGGDFLFSYARGFAPCIPGAEPMVRRKTDRNRFPASGAVAHLYGRLCKCRKRFSAGVPGAKPPAK